MLRHICQRAVRRATSGVFTLLVVGAVFVAVGVSRAANSGEVPPQMPLRPEIRSGGVLEGSYVYHRQQPARKAGAARSVEPAGGWYGYGFPVSTFRWGWFGAAHYYPTVFWHGGYYNDCCRYSYRRGY